MARLQAHVRFTDAPFFQADGETSAAWDGRTLTLTRDRLGASPLFYRRTADGVSFASRQHALFPDEAPTLDLEGVRRLLAFTLSIPGTAWVDVEEVRPGTKVTLTRHGASTATFWALKAREHTDDLTTTVATVRSLLTTAVQARPPAAALLSGGLDSSLLAALLSSPSLDTFNVDFPDSLAHFAADDERVSPDGPYALEVAAHLGTRHHTVTLYPDEISAPSLRRTIVAAYDLPPGWGDRDRSAYRLYEHIHSPTVMSGEGADELFGGYACFFDPAIHHAGTFPWIATGYATYGPAKGALNPEINLDLPSYLSDQYATAARAVPRHSGETAHERGMRIACHVYLTHALPVLLARKEAVSRAAGLTVQTPFITPELVEYVYNVPWSFKTFDGREKSLLRAVADKLLPGSVLARTKSAYPAIRHPAYETALAHDAAALSAQPEHPVFAITDRSWLAAATRLPMTPQTRNTIEWLLNLAAWLELHRPVLHL